MVPVHHARPQALRLRRGDVLHACLQRVTILRLLHINLIEEKDSQLGASGRLADSAFPAVGWERDYSCNQTQIRTSTLAFKRLFDIFVLNKRLNCRKSDGRHP